MITVSPIPDQEVEHIFGMILPLLEGVYKKTALDLIIEPNEILDLLKERKMQLWVGWVDTGSIVGFAITRIDQYSASKTCTIIACGADSRYEHCWEEHIKPIEKWARDVEGCTHLFIDGREGWMRKLRDSGFKVDSVVLSKRLDSNEDYEESCISVEYVH